MTERKNNDINIVCKSQTNVKYIFYKCTNYKRKENEEGNGSKDVQKMKGFERKEEIMTTNSKTVSNGKQGSKDTGFHNTLVYIRQHWQLYLIFLMPALLLTLIFKYAPMSGKRVGRI